MMPEVGYSGTPLVRKLGIKPGSRIALLGAPAGFDATLGELPPGVAVRRRARGPLDASRASHSPRGSSSGEVAVGTPTSRPHR